MNRKLGNIVLGMFLGIGIPSTVSAHCQVPCGIYDDGVRFSLMEEHLATIEKSMNQITDLSNPENANWNQIVRWIENKEIHSDELARIVTYYFMAQRVKPAPQEDKDAHTKYMHEIAWLHQMIIHAMKAKQTTDPDHVNKLRSLLRKFKSSYLGEASKHVGKHDEKH